METCKFSINLLLRPLLTPLSKRFEELREHISGGPHGWLFISNHLHQYVANSMSVPKQCRPDFLALLLVLFVTTTNAFSIPHRQTTLTQQTLHTLRGGQDTSLAAMLPLQSLVEAGPYGVAALTSVAASICIPATQVKNLYGISVGYGLSVAAIGLYLTRVFGPSSILTASIFYGVRLAVHLFVRDVTGYKSLTTDKDPFRLKR